MMFWRVLRQMIVRGRGRLAVALIAIVSGATASAALLNLEFDAERKFSHELRTLGPNVLIRSAVPPGASDEPGSVFSEDVVRPVLAPEYGAGSGPVMALAPSLYLIVRSPGRETSLVLAGTWLDAYPRLAPWWSLNGQWVTDREDTGACLVGQQAAARLLVRPGSSLELRYADRSATLRVAGVVSTGGAEDDQVFANLSVAQKLAGLAGKLSMVQMSVAGTPEQVEHYAAQLGAKLPGMEVRPLRQISQAEGQLLARVHALLFWSVALILTLTSLCVLATTLALAIERRADVGLMKALGGEMTRIIRLFLAEAGLLGAAGGITGAVLGTLLSAWIGRRVFGTATTLRLEVIPLILAVMVAVALVGALPLRLLSHVRPGIVLRESE
ncbi:MAG TPA: ABC transporter permease [Patescibacteria group bacterium]|nr:ABC transporter permease [Patescibacteria group bacterium]